ncbi:unnamed protein product [Cylindrotheca closterium]|uniref:Uncharacterized protein n=1 Tax=Cylindrotheca closterium TaxID=2856 RepID=A0AAD2CR17_9STRA|nr:unnamed protein product [Cylindrotheca closterium]
MVYEKRSSVTSVGSTISTGGKKFKDNLIENIGGESQFNFLVISFCEKIQKDKSLKLFYGGLEMKSLVELQKNMILSAILDVSPEEAESFRGKLILRHHMMFQQGFRAKHFDMLENHFVDAMCDVWLEKDVMDNCTKYFRSLRSIFEDCKNFQDEAALEEDQKMENIRISISSSSLSQQLQDCYISDMSLNALL